MGSQLAAVFVPFAQVSADFIKHSSHLLELVAQLIHFIVTMTIVVIIVIMVPVLSLVMFMDASFNFLCQVMEPGGMQVLDCCHGMVNAFVRMFPAIVMFAFMFMWQVSISALQTPAPVRFACVVQTTFIHGSV
jgi:hypothetical protein